jgi:hypothetical protein
VREDPPKQKGAKGELHKHPSRYLNIAGAWAKPAPRAMVSIKDDAK